MQQSMLQVVNNESEGEFTLKKAQCLKLKKMKIFLNTLLILITGGIWGILLIAFQELRIKFLFDYADDLIETTHLYLMNKDKSYEIQKKLKYKFGTNEKYYVKNKLLNYLIEGEYTSIENCQIQAVEFLPKNITCKELLDLQYNQQNQINDLYQLYGKAEMIIPIPSLLEFLSGVIFKPLQLLLYFSCTIWILEGEIRSSLVTISVTYATFIMTFYFNQKSMKNINKMSQLDLDVQCYRKEGDKISKIQIKSENLLPGDIFEIQNNSTIPVDCILVEGKIVLNEGMLTGESIPVSKQPLLPSPQVFNVNSQQNNILYQGTKVLQLKNQQNLAMVFRTSFSSLKGQLVRTLVFPIIQEDNFMLQFFQLILVIVVYFYIMYIPAFIHMVNADYNLHEIIFRCCDIIIWCVTPYFPFFFSIIQSICLIRLKYKKILGLYPNKLAIAGKVQICCFDKTGTLTTNGMQVKHLMQNQDQFGLISQNNNRDQLIYKIMGTCHNIIMYDGQYMGDVLDIEMLKFSGYNLDQKEIQINHIFEFESKLQRMSVVAKMNDQNYIFAKGSPEKILELSDQQSIPKNYLEILEQQAIKGYRVIALAHKKIDKSEIERDEAEKNLTFDGFLMFLNPLKPDSAQVIKKLNDSYIDTKMISGDNVNTCIETAIQSNILSQDQAILILDYSQDQETILLTGLKDGIIQFKDSVSADDFDINLRSNVSIGRKSIQMAKCEQILSLIQDYQVQFQCTYQIAQTGNFFKILIKSIRQQYKSLLLINNIGIRQSIKISKNDQNLASAKQIVKSCKVFARMRPEQKSQIIQEIQNCGLIVSMTGDGANDCSAIKQSHMGVSFCECEASLSAPFSYMETSIACVEKIILEGRCVLSNYLEIIQYIIMCGFMRIQNVFFMIFYGFFFIDMQFVQLSYFGNQLINAVWGLSKPTLNIYKQIPNDNLLHPSNIIEIILQYLYIAICSSFYYLYCNYANLIEIKGLKENKEHQYYGTVSTVAFCNVYIMQFLIIFLIYKSSPYKQPIYKNYVLFLIFCLEIAYYFYIITGGLGFALELKDIGFKQFAILGSFNVIALIIFVIINQYGIQPIFKKKQQKELVDFYEKQLQQSVQIKAPQTSKNDNE